MGTRKKVWREWHLCTPNDFQNIQSVWESNMQSFGPGSQMLFEPNMSTVVTNILLTYMRRIAELAGVRLPDYIIATEQEVEEIRELHWQEKSRIEKSLRGEEQ